MKLKTFFPIFPALLFRVKYSCHFTDVESRHHFANALSSFQFVVKYSFRKIKLALTFIPFIISFLLDKQTKCVPSV